jgi:hypothetical protein
LRLPAEPRTPTRCLPLVAFLALALLAGGAAGQSGSAASRPLLPALAREMLANLDSRGPAEYSAIFYSRNGCHDLRPRCGYFLGYRGAQALDTGLTLPALARFQGPELKVAIQAALLRMSDAGEPVSQ